MRFVFANHDVHPEPSLQLVHCLLELAQTHVRPNLNHRLHGEKVVLTEWRVRGVRVQGFDVDVLLAEVGRHGVQAVFGKEKGQS